MRLSVVKLIAGKETRDLLRDRRSVMITLVMPILIYPLFGVTAWAFASSLFGPKIIGIVNPDNLTIPQQGMPPLPQLLDKSKTDFDLSSEEKERERDKDKESGPLVLKSLDGDIDALLKSKAADVIVSVPPGFGEEIERGKNPKLAIFTREGDDKSKVAAKRLGDILKGWEIRLKRARFEQAKLPADFDRQFSIEDKLNDRPLKEKAAVEFRDMLARIFPFILTMWVVAGATQPAVDLTAGEKERGTMETLLISPANRSEIVLGKFFAVTFFSFGAAAWNALWLTLCGFALQIFMNVGHEANGEPYKEIINFPGMVGCLILSVPTAMLFASVSVAFGVFARSTKEGQYYLIPLMLVVMPLAFTSMMPGTELTLGNSFIPVTGSLLLQQKMLNASGEPIPWNYFLPVFGSLAVYVALGLALAVWQFNRESVLFRETGPAKSGRGLFGRLMGRK